MYFHGSKTLKKRKVFFFIIVLYIQGRLSYFLEIYRQNSNMQIFLILLIDKVSVEIALTQDLTLYYLLIYDL